MHPKITIQIPETPNDKLPISSGAKPRGSMIDQILQDPKEKMLELGKEEEKAIPFISYDVKKGFVIGEEAEAFLNCMDDDTLIGIICIVGKYRTGKSFFTNRVLLGKEGGQKGFQVGPTVNPCTKGLWLWKKSLEADNPDHEGMKVLLIDTEGFGGTDENVNHDSRIFLFSLLLCSFFIYNSSGSIDENALNGLSLIINLAKDIQLKSGKSKEEELAAYFPAFLWIVRDFTLKIVDEKGNPMTSKEYLEKALDLQKGISDMIESKNRIRKLVKHFFQDRDCITMVRPLEDESRLQKIDSLANSELRPEFVEQMTRARQKIFKKIKPKMLNGKLFNSKNLLELCKAYCDAINTGQVPNIEHAWRYLVKNESNRAMQETLSIVEKELENFLKSPMAQDPNKVKDIKKALEEQAIKNFRRKAIGMDEDIQDYVNMISKDFNEKFKKVKEKNKENWHRVYEDFCKEKFELLSDKLRHDQFSNFYQFQVEFNKFKEEFDKNAPNGPEKEKYWKDLSEKLYAMAAEHVSRRSENVIEKQTQQLRAQLSTAEAQLEGTKQQWTQEKSDLLSQIRGFEKNKLKSLESEGRLETITKEKEKLEKAVKQLKAQLKEKDQELKKNQDFLNSTMEEKVEKMKKEYEKVKEELEKKNSSLMQELFNSKRETESSLNKLNAAETELRKYRDEASDYRSKCESLRGQLTQQELSKSQEIMMMKNEYERKMFELSQRKQSKTEDVKVIQKVIAANDNPDWQLEKKEFESQISFLKGQIEENKKIHDAFLLALQNRDSSSGEANITLQNSSELVLTNKNLSSSLEKMDNRCKQLEEKIEQMKKFRKIVKNSSSVQCLHCSKQILSTAFFQHINSCVTSHVSETFTNSAVGGYFDVSSKEKGDAQNGDAYAPRAVNIDPTITQSIKMGEGDKTLETPTQDQNSQNNNNITSLTVSSQQKKLLQGAKIDQMMQQFSEQRSGMSSGGGNQFTISPNREGEGELRISLNSTAIKEGSDKRPYIEYLLYCSTNYEKWMITRKYKDFADLHHALGATFPSMRFPESANNLFNPLNSDSLNIKKAGFLEERRKLLQQYLRDLAKIEVIRRSKPFKNFLSNEGLSNELLEHDDTPESGLLNSKLSSNLIEPNRNEGYYLTKNGSPVRGYESVIESGSQLLNKSREFSKPDEGLHLKEFSLKIDKKMMPQSPTTFLKAWDENASRNKNSGLTSSSDTGSGHKRANSGLSGSRMNYVGNFEPTARSPDLNSKIFGGFNKMDNSSSGKKPDYTKYSPNMDMITKSSDMFEKSLLSLLNKNSSDKPYEINQVEKGGGSGPVYINKSQTGSNKKK